MAHPFAKQSDAFKGKAAQRYADGGGIQKPAKPPLSIKDLGVKDYAREVNRGMRGGEGPGQFNQSDVFKAGGGAVGYARGGKAGKKGSKVNINIVVPGKGEAASPPSLPLPPPGPGAGAGLAPPGVPMGPPPPMKAGGRVAKARGGRMTAGADTGVGRLQKVKKYRG